ncbi:MAG: magnesium transporter [Proteobacteria bacterium]|nr:magnesium transporter [Pseudomonadota bacterium]
MEPTDAPSAPITAASLAEEASRNAPEEAAALLAAHPGELIAQALARLSPVIAQDLIAALPSEAREHAFAAAPETLSRQWQRNAMYESGSVGRMLEPVAAEFAPSRTVRETVEDLRERVRNTLVTYCFVVDAHEHLLGLITMRDLLFADPDRRLDEVMTKSIFALHTSTPLEEAMKSVLERHYPVYPVVDADGRLRGQVRGQSMFEARAFDITAQAGSMVGVEKEERIASPWKQSLKLRHPWLQLNLLTAFLAAGVVGYFQDTVDRLVILAVFLPVLAGQSGNTGCQALAVTLRGMTLGELQPGSERTLISKEARLGLLNGAGVGLIAAIGMFVIAKSQGSTHAFALAMVVFLAMIGSCVASGLSGALVPLTLKRFGLDPATASSIFLTTATDVVSMGMLLGLATLLVV